MCLTGVVSVNSTTVNAISSSCAFYAQVTKSVVKKVIHWQIIQNLKRGYHIPVSNCVAMLLKEAIINCFNNNNESNDNVKTVSHCERCCWQWWTCTQLLSESSGFHEHVIKLVAYICVHQLCVSLRLFPQELCFWTPTFTILFALSMVSPNCREKICL